MTTIGWRTIAWRFVIAAETTKILTDPIAVIPPLISMAFNVSFAVLEASGATFFVTGTKEAVTIGSFAVVMFAPVYVFLVLPVRAAASEHREGQIRLTLACVPSRGRLATCKVVALSMVVGVASIVTIAPARIIIGAARVSPAELAFDVLRWSAAYALMSLIGFGLAWSLRSMVASMGLLVALPVLLATGIVQWPEAVRFLPDQASLSLLGTPAYVVTALEPGVAAIVLCAWATLSLCSFAVTLILRDA